MKHGCHAIRIFTGLWSHGTEVSAIGLPHLITSSDASEAVRICDVLLAWPELESGPMAAIWRRTRKMWRGRAKFSGLRMVSRRLCDGVAEAQPRWRAGVMCGAWLLLRVLRCVLVFRLAAYRGARLLDAGAPASIAAFLFVPIAPHSRRRANSHTVFLYRS